MLISTSETGKVNQLMSIKSCRIRFKIRSMIEDVAFDYKFKLVTSGGDILAEQTVNVPVANIELEYQNIFILPATFNLDNLQLISGDSKPARVNGVEKMTYFISKMLR